MKIIKYVFQTSLLLLNISCGDKTTGNFFSGTLGLGEARIIVASSDATANSINYSVALYSISGKFLGILADYTSSSDVPRGLAQISPLKFLVPLDGIDRIEILDIFGNRTSYPENAQFSGTLADIAVDSQGRAFAIEGNTIEMFEADGSRTNGVSATPLIAATTGLCILNNPRTLTFTPSGALVVANMNLNNMLIYSITGTNVSCTSVVAVPNAPYAILMHSDGSLYIGRQTNDAILRANTDGSGQTDIYTNATYVNNPTVLAELPDGSILFASDGTNSIEQVTTTGTRLGTFIQDSFTNNVSDIIILRGQ